MRIIIESNSESITYEDGEKRRVIYIGKNNLIENIEHLVRKAQEKEEEKERLKEAVQDFSVAMIEKLHRKVDEGYSGWANCTKDELYCKLQNHVKKGDPIDIANFCMFLWYSEKIND